MATVDLESHRPSAVNANVFYFKYEDGFCKANVGRSHVDSIVEETSIDEPGVPPVKNTSRESTEDLNRMASYDSMAPSQERIIQEAEESSVSLRELPSLNTSQIEEQSIAPLGDALEKTPRGWDDETISKICDALRKRTKEKKVASDLGNNIVYIEKRGYFSKKSKTRRDSQKPKLTGIESILSKLDSNVPAKYRDVATAFIVQRAYHNIALIIQGFLSGLSLGQAVFAIKFATEELLVEGYRSMSLPVHVVFVVSFTIACVAALDRLEFYGLSWESIGKTIGHHGFLGAVLWSFALISSLLCIKFDELLSGKEKIDIPHGELLFWRICCGVRAVCAAAAWLLLALRPESDVLGEALQQCVGEEVENELAQRAAERQDPGEMANVPVDPSQQPSEDPSSTPDSKAQ